MIVQFEIVVKEPAVKDTMSPRCKTILNPKQSAIPQMQEHLNENNIKSLKILVLLRSNVYSEDKTVSECKD